MANPVATVAFIQGQAWAKAPDGSLRVLSLGATLAADEVLVTADGARVELDFGEGEPVAIAGGQEVGMGPDLWEVTVTDSSDAVLADASVQQALTILEQGGDLLEELEETAAGSTDGNSGGGNSFVQVARADRDENNQQEFEYGLSFQNESNGTLTGRNGENHAPVVENMSLIVDEDVVITGRVPALDIENDPMTFALGDAPLHGAVTVNPVTGEFEYRPDANYFGVDSFTIIVSDSWGNTSTSLINLDVAPVNDAPVAQDLQLSTDEDVAVTGQVIATDIEGDELSFSLADAPANGSVTLDAATGNFIYTPNPDYHGGDRFTVTVTDGQGGVTTAIVDITVAPINDAPVSADLNLVTDEDVPVAGQIAASDVDGDNLTYTVTGPANAGSVVLDPVTGDFIYTPNTNYHGGDSFVVTISDGNGGTTTSTVTIGVLPVNDAPVASNLHLNTLEATPVNGAINARDPDGDSLTYNMSGTPSYGSVTLDPTTGSFVYTPSAGYTGSDSFVVTVSDGNGGSATSTVTIGIQPLAPMPVNQAPTAHDDSATTNEATPVTIAVRANDTDPDGDSLIITSVTQGANGSVVVDPISGNPVYTPAVGFAGADSFTYTIDDGHGHTATATVQVTVNAVDAPTIMVAENETLAEDTSIAGNVLTNDSDADDLLEIVSYEINGTSYGLGATAITGIGDFELSANGDYKFIPIADYHGPVPVITYFTNTGASSTLTLTVTPVNDAPVAVDDKFAIGADVQLVIDVNDLLANDTDIDGDSLQVVSVSNNTNGTVVLSGSTITFTPSPGYSGPASFEYEVSDGNGGSSTAVVEIDVTPGNSPPQTHAINVTGDEDTVIQINLSGTDADGSVAGFIINNLPANGALFSDIGLTQLITAGDLVIGPIYFQPSTDWNGSTSFDYAAQDNEGLTDATPARVDITVNPVADAALLGAGAGSVKEDTPAETSATGVISIVDPDQGEDAFQVQTNTPGAYGFFSIDAAGQWTYTLDNSNPAVQALAEGQSETEIFTVSSLDGTQTTVTITVIGTNDAPVARADTATTDIATPVTIAVLGNDTDPDGDPLKVDSAFVDPAYGTVIVNGDNTLTFTPSGGTPGTVAITYTISDSYGGTSTSTVEVTVLPVNTAPVAMDDPSADPYSINLGAAGTSSWLSVDSKGQTVSVVAFNADGSTGVLFQNGDSIGVAGTPRPPATGKEEPTQIEYDPDSDTSESILVTVNANLTSATFSVSNLYASESGGEIGHWTAYFKGAVVAMSSFHLTSGDKGTFAIDTGGFVFDTVRFSALHSINGTGDGGGYFLTDFTGTGAAQANSNYVVAENGSLNISSGSAANLLENDTDADGDALTITHINGLAITDGQVVTLGSGALLTINSDGSFNYTPNGQFDALTAGELATDSFTYTVTDGFGGSATANAEMTIIGTDAAPIPPVVPVVSEISGTAGSDTLVGTLGADTFKWNLNDQGTAGAPVQDQVVNFNSSQGDILDLADLLQGESAANLTDYLHFDSDGTHSTIHISSQGNFTGGVYDASVTDQTIVLQNVNLSGTDTDIINQLKSAGNLLTN